MYVFRRERVSKECVWINEGGGEREKKKENQVIEEAGICKEDR
jgi:hypothetical protein